MSEQRIANYILLSLVLGIVCGWFLYDPGWSAGTMPLAEHRYGTLLGICRFIGLSVFLSALKVLILPLVASTVFVAVANIGARQLGKLGSAALLYYFSTMLLAVGLGIALVVLLAPGLGLEELQLAETEMIQTPESAQAGMLGILENLTSLILPSNIFMAMAEGQILSVICFFIFLGVVVALLGDEASSITRFAEALSACFLKMVHLVLYLAPLGVFCLIVDSIAQYGITLFSQALGRYVVCVVLGLMIHGCLVLPLLLRIFSTQRVFSFFASVKAAILMAFGTASSSATLPVSMRVARDSGLSPRSSAVVLPLGSTVNMDGTALYEAVAVIFLAQLSGVELGAVQLLVITFTATLAAVGAAGIPSAGLVTLFIVVDAVNASLGSVGGTGALVSTAGIALILGVDRILDMLRTAVNVWGDLVGAAILDTQLNVTLDSATSPES